ncbi:lysine-specific demethylase 4C isoform X1 [Pelobates cultripes]|uniref:[histone H3]-trimethyl-L-lysine(9) demethylase n=1 Tax=Pelobates cultripes TaxID=61616 RepID=A0AAD1S9B6_PELCU|nr:lysine-specific demethylase 4C isoform X1 [Pelobates cultripes]
MDTVDSEELNPACKIMTFRPTMEEFKDFNKYLVYMESKGAHRSGLAKVIPPKGWKPKTHYDDIDDLVIPAPIQQMVTGQSGLFTQYNIQKKPITVKEFRRLANSDKYCTPRYMDYEDLERKYWKNLTFVAPIYGADVNGSLYDENINEWNISCLNTILDVIGEECGISIEGVNTPYLYFGMWKTTFAWHTEDMDLYSINYLHFGEPKSWYAIPPEHGKRLERLAQGFFPSSSQGCEAFLRHKMTLISPSILKKYGIPFDKVTQEAGEFMITFPYGYHAGFNHGFNCAESTNFATVRWIDYGKIAKLCSCSSDMVKISMDIFVKKFQPDKYQIWKQGKDTYVIDHTKPTSDPTPEERAWLLRRKKRNRLKNQRQTRSRSKKLRTLEDKKVSALVAGAEIIATETAADGFKVNEKPTEKATLVNKEEPSGDVKNIREVHLDHSLLNNIQAPGSVHNPSDQETKHKDKANSHLNLVSSGSETLPGSCAPSAELKIKKGTHSREESKQNVLCQKPQVYDPSEAESLEKEEASSVSSEEEASDFDVNENGLEPGEIPNAVSDEMKDSGTDTIYVTSQGENKTKRPQTTKSWRLPLSKPPSRSPMTIVKQQTTSDEEFSECPLVDDTAEETELWAKPLRYLWQTNVQNFAAEREYNSSVSKIKPYCAICTLLLPYYKSDTYNDDIQLYWETLSNEITPLEPRTKPLIPEMCFMYSEVNTDNSPPNSFIEDDGRSQLITCSKCRVKVHASCYGVPSQEIHDGWMCSRCRIGVWTAECCLCNLRGGALKQTTDEKWAHVICAIGVPEVRFKNVTERSQIDTSRIPLERLKLKCIFCRQKVKEVYGACIQCSYGRCPTSFHVTCAHAAGVLMEPDDWPFVVYITCFRHLINQNVRSKSAKKEITVGQTVIAKHRNTRYYSCRVTEVTSQTFYEVVFDDGSTSKDTFPEDIVSRDCLKLGPPAEGEVVQVKWPDGLLYGAKYLGNNIVYMYRVEFEDGSQIVTKREDIYTLDEELPKKIKSRYSKASDMKFEDAFYGEEVIRSEKKRQRVLNVKFKNEYVDDPGYRTFLRSSFQKKCQNGL